MCVGAGCLWGVWVSDAVVCDVGGLNCRGCLLKACWCEWCMSVSSV